MRKSHVNLGLRALGLGVAFACLGFTLALATSGDAGGRGTSLGNRGISTICTRPPTTFITNSNLGLVVVGTQFTRQILVQFGFKPHTFAFGEQQPYSNFDISPSGTISGTKSDKDPETFEVRVFDEGAQKGANFVQKSFTITGVDYAEEPDLALQFVNGHILPNAVSNDKYSFTLHANGGTPPYTFELQSDIDVQNLPAGLALDPDTGEIFGKPILPTSNGPAIFTIVLTDDVGTVRTKTFNLTVLPGTISSDLVVTSGNFRLNFGTQGTKDALKFSAILNRSDMEAAGIRATSDLEGVDISLNFGGVQIPPKNDTTTTDGTTPTTFPTKFDKNGQVKFPNVLLGLMPQNGESTQFQINLNPKTGVLKVNASGLAMIKALNANFSTFKDPIIPISIKIGQSAANANSTSTTATTGTTTGTTTDTTAANDPNAGIDYDKTDVCKFIYRRQGSVSKGSALANTKVPPGGLFLITHATGSEVHTGEVTDRVILKFTGILRGINGAPVQFNTGDTVDVLLSTACMGEFPATSLKSSGNKLTFRNDDLSAGLANFVIDNKKGTVYFDTHPILPRDVFGVDILNGGEPLIVPVTITISTPGTTTPSFDGQSSIAIFRVGNKLQSK